MTLPSASHSAGTRHIVPHALPALRADRHSELRSSCLVGLWPTGDQNFVLHALSAFGQPELATLTSCRSWLIGPSAQTPARTFGSNSLDESFGLIRQSELRSSCLDEHFVFIRNSAFHASCLRLLMHSFSFSQAKLALTLYTIMDVLTLRSGGLQWAK